jgi:hypothetical protein
MQIERFLDRLLQPLIDSSLLIFPLSWIADSTFLPGHLPLTGVTNFLVL